MQELLHNIAECAEQACYKRDAQLQSDRQPDEIYVVFTDSLHYPVNQQRADRDADGRREALQKAQQPHHHRQQLTR